MEAENRTDFFLQGCIEELLKKGKNKFKAEFKQIPAPVKSRVDGKRMPDSPQDHSCVAAFLCHDQRLTVCRLSCRKQWEQSKEKCVSGGQQGPLLYASTGWGCFSFIETRIVTRMTDIRNL